MITGVAGMAGSHLVDYLTGEVGVERVYGLDLKEQSKDRIAHAQGLVYVDCDVRDFRALWEVMESVRPTVIFHLAAMAFVPFSWERPAECIEHNVCGTVNVLEVVRRLGRPTETFVQVACSSEQYGLVYPDEVPIREDQPFRPLSTYGVTKVATELLALQYAKSYGLRSVVTRTFNHTGPRQEDLYVLSSFVRQALEVRYGEAEAIYHGDLSPVRDFTDVRDVVRAYVLAVDYVMRVGLEAGVFQIGGGAVKSMREVLEAVCQRVGVSRSKAKQDPRRLRPSDVPRLVCDSSRFR